MNPYKANDQELGEFIRKLAVECATSTECGSKAREAFDHRCQGLIDGDTLADIKNFAMYMKDAWATPEGENCFFHAMKVLGRFKRHEKRLRECVESPDHEDVVILAACQLIKDAKKALKLQSNRGVNND